MVAEVLLIPIVLAFGLISVLLVGVVGGPIKTETPLITTVFHGIAFLALAREWPVETVLPYLIPVVACLGVQVVVAFDLLDEDRQRLPLWLARGLLASAYAGMMVLVLRRLP